MGPQKEGKNFDALTWDKSVEERGLPMAPECHYPLVDEQFDPAR